MSNQPPTVATIAQHLQETLGQRLVAYAIGVRDPKEIGKYSTGHHHAPTPKRVCGTSIASHAGFCRRSSRRQCAPG